MDAGVGSAIVGSVVDGFLAIEFLAALSGVFSFGVLFLSVVGVVPYKFSLIQSELYLPWCIWLNESHDILDLCNSVFHRKGLDCSFDSGNSALSTQCTSQDRFQDIWEKSNHGLATQ